MKKKILLMTLAGILAAGMPVSVFAAEEEERG